MIAARTKMQFLHFRLRSTKKMSHDFAEIALSLVVDKGPGPHEGRQIVSWMVASDTPECATITMQNEASLVCGLMMDLGFLFTLNTSINGGDSFYNDINIKKPQGISIHERRGYFISPDGNGQSEKHKLESKGQSLNFTNKPDEFMNAIEQTLSTTSIQHQHNGIAAVMDPTDLLQLPPHVIGMRLKLIATCAEKALKSISKQSGEKTSSKYSGDSLISWMLSEGVVRSAAHAMLLSNVLYNYGCITIYESKKSSSKNDGEPKRALTRGNSHLNSTPDPKLPFGDTPDMVPLTSTADDGDTRQANELVSNSKVSTLRFQFSSVKEKNLLPGTPVPSTPTPEALAYVKKNNITAASQTNNSLLNLTNNNIVSDFDLNALSMELAAEEAALRSDTKTLAKDVLSLSECESMCRVEQKKLLDEKAEMQNDRNQLLMHQFVNEARQVKMLSELQNIYPIHLVEKSGESEVWAIRSLELPKDFTTLDEEHISSALGYVVHLVAMISKYLQIPLRYQLIYAASRSSIRDRVGITTRNGSTASSGNGGDGGSGDGGGIFPLYRRGVEPSKFEKATAMLAADIEQILWCRSVRSEAVMKMYRPMDEEALEGLNAGISLGTNHLAAASGTDMLMNLEKLLRYEICSGLN